MAGFETTRRVHCKVFQRRVK